MEFLELIMYLLLIFGIALPIAILVCMLLFVWVKRCPLCGKKMKFNYGSGIVGYTCERCRKLEIKVLR